MSFDAFLIVFLDSADNYKVVNFGIYSEQFPTVRGPIVSRVMFKISGDSYAEAETKLSSVLNACRHSSFRINERSLSWDWQQRLQKE
jgi:hypothetical protein